MTMITGVRTACGVVFGFILRSHDSISTTNAELPRSVLQTLSVTCNEEIVFHVSRHPANAKYSR